MVYWYDPETKVLCHQVRRRCDSRNYFETFLAFFHVQGIVHIDLPRGCTINAVFYVEVLKRLHETVRWKRQEMWKSGWLLHHDNAPSHTSLLVQEFMTGKNIIAVLHAHYSPDLVPCDFWLFPKVRMTLKGNYFNTVEEIKLNTTNRIKFLMKEDFQMCFRQWQEWWNKCLCSGGECFEGDFW